MLLILSCYRSVHSLLIKKKGVVFRVAVVPLVHNNFRVDDTTDRNYHDDDDSDDDDGDDDDNDDDGGDDDAADDGTVVMIK